MTPEYPVVSNTALLVPAINSPNFNLQNPSASPQPSWAILQNGLAYFFGLVLSGTFTGPDYIINSQGFFLYNGAPALGNLAFSFSAQSGVDEFGNVFFAGIWAYNASGGGGAALVTVSGQAGLVLPPSNVSTMSIPPQVTSFSGNDGLANEFLSLILDSGKETTNTGNTAVQLFSETNDGTGGARGSLVITGTEVIGWNANNATVTTPGGLQGTIPASQSDITIDTNANLTGPNPATKQWTIPANNAQVGSIYEIESPFSVITGTVAESVGFKPNFNGSAVTTSGGDTIGATAVAASTTYTGEVRLRLVIRTTGTGGTCDIFIKGGMAIAANLQGTVDAWFLSSQATGQAINTQIANTIGIDSVWGGNPSGSTQTVANRGSEFSRKGT